MPVVPTVNVPPDVATITGKNAPEDAPTTVTFPLIWTRPDDAEMTVGLDDRLNTVESVTGIVPPDVATMTKGADESVTVPEVKLPIWWPADDAAITVGIPLICTSPDEALRIVTVPAIVTVPEVIVVAVLLTVGAELRVNVPDDTLTN